MKKVLAIVGILLLAFVGYIYFFYFRSGKRRDRGPKPQSEKVSKHDEAFNQSVGSVLDAYYKMTEAFVNWDTTAIDQSASELKIALDSFRINDLKKDSIIYLTALDPLANSKSSVALIISSPSIDSKRVSLNDLSDNLQQLLRTVKYDQAKLYWQECPMAFGEERPGNWLSKTDAVRNPYLGLKHPKFKDQMLDCGGPKDTINFMMADTTHIH